MAVNEGALEQVTRQVAVIGGGVAGLCVAYELRRRGISFLLLEADDQVGGRIRTIEYPQGLTVEAGLHEYWSHNPLVKLAAELGVELEPDDGAPYPSVLLGGQLFLHMDGSSQEFLASVFSEAELKQVEHWHAEVGALIRLADQQGLQAETIARLQGCSFADWVAQLALPTRVAEWIRMTIESEIAADWTSFSALLGVLSLRFLVDSTQGCFYIPEGNQRLPKALAGVLAPDVLCGARVTRIERDTDVAGSLRAQLSVVVKGVEQRLSVERVVLAVPFSSLDKVEIVPPLPNEYTDSLRGLIGGQYTVVHLIVKQEVSSLLPVYSLARFPILTPGLLGVIYGLVTAEDCQDALMTLLIKAEHASLFRRQPREKAIALLLSELERLWPGFSRFVRDAAVFEHLPVALPVWPPGRSPLDAQTQLLSQPHMGLYLAGDYTAGVHSDAAAHSGLQAATRIAADLSTTSESSTQSGTERAPL